MNKASDMERVFSFLDRNYGPSTGNPFTVGAAVDRISRTFGFTPKKSRSFVMGWITTNRES